MNAELKKLMERFETEIWLYIDGSLNHEDKAFWDEQISKHDTLKQYYRQTLSALEKYAESNLISISEINYQNMMTETFNTNTLGSGLYNFITRTFDILFSDSLSSVKVVLTASLAVIALILLLTTERPNAVKNISRDILSWQGESISQELNAVDNSLNTLSMDEWEKYQYIQATHDEWEQTFYLLNNKIEKMQKEIEDTSL